ncbi:MAG: M48 family metallopeptidase [Bacteroidales bacterium]|nr:M48 family metallopeptidase [Bacteroidales bacterium]
MKIGSLDIEIRRSARKKTITVNVERDGSVNAVVPAGCSDETIYKELLAREYTICKHVANRKAVNKAQINRQFVNGQSFLYMGESYNLEIVETANKRRPISLHINDDKFILDEKQLPKARETFIKFYKTSGRPYVEKRVAHFVEMVGHTPSAISIRELGAHWASCTPQQKINFHWKCIMAPPKIIDYLIVHELTHLKYPQHTRQFWDAVFSVMPNYKECEDWLHDYGVTLDL